MPRPAMSFPATLVSLRGLRELSLASPLIDQVHDWLRAHRPGLQLGICAFLTVSSLLLGGGTRAGFVSDVLLQLIAIPAGLISLSCLIELLWEKPEAMRRARSALALCAAIALFPLIQLVPLPPAIWTNLPGRESVKGVFDLLNDTPPWRPITVSPNATWISFVSLLPPLTIFFGVIQLSYRERRGLSLLIIAIGLVSAFVGLLQVAEGPNSGLRFFTVTNSGEAVGFFANRNHFAALLYSILVFAMAWIIDITPKAGSVKNISRFEPRMIAILVAGFVIPIVFLTSEGMARSRAGLGLAMVALAAAFLIAMPNRQDPSIARADRLSSTKLLRWAIALAIMLVVQFALYRILDRFQADPLEDARIWFAHDTMLAARAFMPFGSGMGTFVPVYAIFEEPQHLLADAYVNHAHNDFLELWLETGVFGIAILVAFGVWFASKAAKMWRSPPVAAHRIDLFLGRGAVVVIALLAAHSLVDYPLRTNAIMAIFAFACALLVEPLHGDEPDKGMRRAVPQQMSQTKSEQDLAKQTPPHSPGRTAAEPRAVVSAKPPPQSGGRWGEDEGIKWPDQWTRFGTGSASGDGEGSP